MRTIKVRNSQPTCAKVVRFPTGSPVRMPRAKLPTVIPRNLAMLPPKALLDTLAGHAARLFNGETPLPHAEIEAQLKALLQSAFSKLDLVSRDEFDSQMTVLARTRTRLESLEAKVAELEARLNPPAS